MAAPGADPHGISLERYAAVVAAVAEPFARGRVLRLEEIDPAELKAAEVEWKRRIARRDGVDLARYREALAAAEDWLLRRVTPLYQEPRAWAAFLAVMRVSPAEVLAATGLGNNDFARLTRHWARLTREDRDLGRDIEACLSDGPGALPKVVAEPRQLRRSRVFTPRPGPRSATPAPGPARARVIIVKEIAPESVVRQAPPPAAIPGRASIADAEEHETAALPAIGYLHDKPTLPFSPAPPEDHGTAALPAIKLSLPALPFAPRVAEEHETAALPAITAPKPSLPFAPAKDAYRDLASPPSPLPLDARAATPFVASAAEEHGTAELPVVPSTASPLPFAQRAVEEHGTLALPAIRVPSAAPPSAARPDTPPPQPSARAPESCALRSPAPELPLRLEQYASLCVELGAWPDRPAEIGARYGLSPEARAALDAAYGARFAQDPALLRSFHQAAAAYSAWLGAARAALPGSVPAFTIEQYASLAVELSRSPDRRSETMARYRISEPQRAALDAAFAARFAQDPAARQAFERACSVYAAMLSRGG